MRKHSFLRNQLVSPSSRSKCRIVCRRAWTTENLFRLLGHSESA
jgi:hypothetical protein